MGFCSRILSPNSCFFIKYSRKHVFPEQLSSNLPTSLCQHSLTHLFIHSFRKYLPRAFWLPGALMDSGTKQIKPLASRSLACTQWGEKQIFLLSGPEKKLMSAKARNKLRAFQVLGWYSLRSQQRGEC